MRPDWGRRNRCRAVLRSWGDPPDVAAGYVCLGLRLALPHPVLERNSGRIPAVEVLPEFGDNPEPQDWHDLKQGRGTGWVWKVLRPLQCWGLPSCFLCFRVRQQ